MLRVEKSLALINLKELVREKYLHGLIVISVVFLALSSFLSVLGIDEKTRILFHMGIFSIQICAFLSALIFGSSVLAKDIQQQTFQIILARPVSRFQFLISKVISSFLLLAVIPWFLGLILCVLLEFEVGWRGMFQNLLGIMLESWILFIFTFFLSTFSRPSLSFLLGGVFYLAGHWRNDVAYFAKRSREASWMFASNVLDYILPPLDALDLKSITFAAKNIWSEKFLLGSCVVLVWIVVFIFAAHLSWKERDLV